MPVKTRNLSPDYKDVMGRSPNGDFLASTVYIHKQTKRVIRVMILWTINEFWHVLKSPRKEKLLQIIVSGVIGPFDFIFLNNIAEFLRIYNGRNHNCEWWWRRSGMLISIQFCVYSGTHTGRVTAEFEWPAGRRAVKLCGLSNGLLWQNGSPEWWHVCRYLGALKTLHNVSTDAYGVPVAQ